MHLSRWHHDVGLKGGICLVGSVVRALDSDRVDPSQIPSLNSIPLDGIMPDVAKSTQTRSGFLGGTLSTSVRIEWILFHSRYCMREQTEISISIPISGPTTFPSRLILGKNCWVYPAIRQFSRYLDYAFHGGGGNPPTPINWGGGRGNPPTPLNWKYPKIQLYSRAKKDCCWQNLKTM